MVLEKNMREMRYDEGQAEARLVVRYQWLGRLELFFILYQLTAQQIVDPWRSFTCLDTEFKDTIFGFRWLKESSV